MHLILPIAGESSRFPGMRPKWMLTHPNGNLMIAEAIREIDPAGISRILAIGLKAHDQTYGVQEVLRRQIAALGLERLLEVVLLEQSRSQPDTVVQGLKAAAVSGPILIKDCDNSFRFKLRMINEVCYARIGDIDTRNVAGKSYLLLDETGRVVSIAEKQLISDMFCCGGYGFAEAADFIRVHEKLQDIPNLYVSHIIYQMLLEGAHFSGAHVDGYLDWGTLEDWNAYRSRFVTLFVDLDGTLVESSARYFKPCWGETEAIAANVEVLNRLYDSGYGQIIVVTCRGPEYEQTTVEQLHRIGLKYHRVLFGLFHGKRIIINDYSRSNPYRSCDAINLRRNSAELAEMLGDLVPLPRAH